MVKLRQSTPDDGARVVEIWRDAVDATHDFLTAADRLAIDGQVRGFLPATPLWLAIDGDERITGFMGLTGDHMDALFIDPAHRGTGVGRALVQHALALHGTLTTDVNEQNRQAVGFYRRVGFIPTGRSAVDGEGRPYPLIHMRWQGAVPGSVAVRIAGLRPRRQIAPMKTPRLRIRPLGASDAEALHPIHELVGHGRAHRTLDELGNLYREMETAADGDPGWHGYVLELQSGKVIGDVGVRLGHPEERQAEIGYCLHPDFWRAGYATEALEALLGDMFSRRRLHRVVAITTADNIASRALLARLGFRLEGHHASAFYEYRTERWVDSVSYALLASEWNTGGGGMGTSIGA